MSNRISDSKLTHPPNNDATLVNATRQEQPQEHEGLIKEFLHSAAYAAVQEPVTGLSQAIDHIAGTKLEQNLTFMSKPEGANGTGDWIAQQLGGAAGMLLPFMLVRGGVKGVMGESTQTAATLGMSLKEAGMTGFAYQALLKPTEGNPDNNFWVTRGLSGVSGAATFMTLTASAYGLGKLSEVAQSRGSFGLVPLMRNPILAGIASGLPAGVVSAEGSSLVNNHKFASGSEIGQSIAGMALIGGVFGANEVVKAKYTDGQSIPKFVTGKIKDSWTASSDGARLAGGDAEGQSLNLLWSLSQGSHQQQLAMRLKATVNEFDKSAASGGEPTDPLAQLTAQIREEKLAVLSTKAGAPPVERGFDVVLGASGAETTAHIGFLQALEDKNVPVGKYVGASGGSLVATFAANGFKAAEIKDILLSDEFRNTRPSVMMDCMHVMDPWNLWPYAFDFKPWLKDVISRYDLKPQPNLRIVAADATTHAPVVFEGTDYDLATALAASTAATPAMGLKPVTYKGQTLIDGFYYHPIPAALGKDPPAIVSKIGFTTKFPSQLLSPFDYFMHVKEMMSAPEMAAKYPDPPGNIIATTGLPDVAMTAFGIPTATLQKLIDHGYKATTERLEQPDAVAALKSRAGAADAPSTIPIKQPGTGRTTAALVPPGSGKAA